MNAKKVKQLRKRIKPLQLEWLQSILLKEQADNITLNNIESYLPQQKYIFARGQLRLSFMSDRWIIKNLKRNPNIKSYLELEQIQARN